MITHILDRLSVAVTINCVAAAIITSGPEWTGTAAWAKVFVALCIGYAGWVLAARILR